MSDSGRENRQENERNQAMNRENAILILCYAAVFIAGLAVGARYAQKNTSACIFELSECVATLGDVTYMIQQCKSGELFKPTTVNR